MRSATAAITLLVCAVGLCAPGQTYVYIPDSNPGLGTCDPIPFSPKETRFVMLIMAYQIGQAGAPQKITDIAFAPCVTGTFQVQRLQIRMWRTTLTTLSSCFTSMLKAPTVVYDGPWTWKAVKDTWSPVGLQFPFATDGWLNVLIEIRFKGVVTTLGVPVHSAPAFQRVYNNTSTNPFSDPCTNRSPEMLGPKIRLAIQNQNMLLGGDHVHIGFASPIRLLSCPPGHFYQLATALGQLPLNLGGYRINLAPDPLFWLSLSGTVPYFQQYSGRLDPVHGAALAMIGAPKDPRLIGVWLWHAAVTYDNQGISAVTNTGEMDIQP